jgi:hypothetical protein
MRPLPTHSRQRNLVARPIRRKQINRPEKKPMKLVNETGVAVNYWISSSGMADCGQIDADGVADLPGYDNQQNVTVSFLPANSDDYFRTTWAATKTGQQTEVALVAE